MDVENELAPVTIMWHNTWGSMPNPSDKSPGGVQQIRTEAKDNRS